MKKPVARSLYAGRSKPLPWMLLLLLAACVKRVPGPDDAVVFVAARIDTQDDARPVAEAIAWRHGKIVAVGGKREVLAAAGSGAAVEEFPTSVIMPGLIDAHVELPFPPKVNDDERASHIKSALERWAQLGLTQVHVYGVDLRTLRFFQSYDMLGVLPVRVYVVVKDDVELVLGHGPFAGRRAELKAAVDDGSHAAQLIERGFQVSVPAAAAPALGYAARVDFPEGEAAEGVVTVTSPDTPGVAVGAQAQNPLSLLATKPELLTRYTRGGALASRSEDRRGQLKVGFDADFVLVDAAGKVLLTVVDGVDVYRSP